MRVIFMGTPEFGVPTLEALQRAGHEIVVYTAPDRPAGRGRQLRSSPVNDHAVQFGLTVLQPSTLRRPEEWQRIAAYRPDSIVVGAYGLILPTEVLQASRLGCLNLHPSLLPRYRGATPIPAAILGGDKVTGVTVFFMNKRVDAGDILGQRKVPIDVEDTVESLGLRLAALGAELVIDVLTRQDRGQIVPVPQEEGQATFTKRLIKADGLIDWSQPAVHIARMARAYYPWPGAFTRWQGKSIKLASVRPASTTELAPGEVAIGPDTKSLFIGTGDGQLDAKRLQLEGRREMDASQFIRGNQDISGARLD